MLTDRPGTLRGLSELVSLDALMVIVAVLADVVNYLAEGAPFALAWWAFSRVRKLEKRLENNPCFTE